jgi:hypothetical protein
LLPVAASPLQREEKSSGGLGSQDSSRYCSTDTLDSSLFSGTINEFAAPDVEDPADNLCMMFDR